MMPYPLTNVSLILREGPGYGPSVARPNQSSQLGKADHLEGVTQGEQGPHSMVLYLYSDQIFDRYVQMQRVFDDAFVLHDSICIWTVQTLIFLIYIHDMR